MCRVHKGWRTWHDVDGGASLIWLTIRGRTSSRELPKHDALSTTRPREMFNLHRIHFKVLLIVFKSLAPACLFELVQPHNTTRALKSSNQLLLAVPRTRWLSTCGDRTFSVAAPKLWNSLRRLELHGPLNSLRLSWKLTSLPWHAVPARRVILVLTFYFFFMFILSFFQMLFLYWAFTIPCFTILLLCCSIVVFTVAFVYDYAFFNLN